jgi:hypothetical protein
MHADGWILTAKSALFTAESGDYMKRNKQRPDIESSIWIARAPEDME